MARRVTRTLCVHLGERIVGRLRLAASGETSFAYDDAWIGEEGAPISRSLPLRRQPYLGGAAISFFDGLLPDAEAIRVRIAEREGAASTRPFDLLDAIGRDCVGALRFLPEGAPVEPAGPPTGRLMTLEEVAERVRGLKTAPLGRVGGEFRISIAGAQDKTALLRLPDGRWMEPAGSTPTSHILKPPIGVTQGGLDLSSSVEAEWLSLALCRAFGLEAALAEVMAVETTAAGPVKWLAVERFDRVWRDGVLRRIHQEDMAQAFGAPTLKKYESEGGPGVQSIIALLRESDRPDQDTAAFLKAQMVFWLLAAPDGHAKNFSIQPTRAGFRLAPLYDVMTSIPYAHVREFHPRRVKLAMAIGASRKWKVDEICPRHWCETAEAALLDRDLAPRLMADIAAKAPSALDEVSQTLPQAVSHAFFEPVAQAVLTRAARFAG